MSKSKTFEISKQIIWEAWQKVKKNKGSFGVDGDSIVEVEANLENNLYKLWNRMSSGSYFPPAVRGVDIPKKDGKFRRLGVPTVLDRVAQTAIKMLLEPELEPVFLEDSYGYRPDRSAHDAIAVTRNRCFKYDWVLEFDVVGMFDNIPHELILKALRHHTSCKFILVYVERWLTAPMLTPDGQMQSRSKGTPQGGVISPLMMNLFMHYTFDCWMTRNFSTLPWCRYADDGLIHCKTEQQGKQVLSSLEERFAECGLTLHQEKTRLVYCSDGFRHKKTDRLKEFTFLSFDFKARNAKSKRTGRVFRSFQPAVSQEALKAMIYKIKHVWKLRKRVDLDFKAIAKWINPVVRGWINYYGKFYKTALYRLCLYLNQTLSLLARKKYKRLYRKFGSCYEFTKAMYQENPKLFAHWQFLKVY